jgi:hypothetical protein
MIATSAVVNSATTSLAWPQTTQAPASSGRTCDPFAGPYLRSTGVSGSGSTWGARLHELIQINVARSEVIEHCAPLGIHRAASRATRSSPPGVPAMEIQTTPLSTHPRRTAKKRVAQDAEGLPPAIPLTPRHWVRDCAALRRDLTEKLAYGFAEQRGFAPGGELQDWLRAEAEVDQWFEGEHYCGD